MARNPQVSYISSLLQYRITINIILFLCFSGCIGPRELGSSMFTFQLMFSHRRRPLRAFLMKQNVTQNCINFEKLYGHSCVVVLRESIEVNSFFRWVLLLSRSYCASMLLHYKTTQLGCLMLCMLFQYFAPRCTSPQLLKYAWVGLCKRVAVATRRLRAFHYFAWNFALRVGQAFHFWDERCYLSSK